MTITYRDQITRDLTPAEVDANFRHVLDSANTTFLQSGTGATARTIAAKLQDGALSVKDFGCVGDGTTDDTSNFNAAIAAAKSAGKSLFIPKGSYKVTSTLTSIDGQFEMFGEGMQESQILFIPTAGDVCIDVSNGGSRVERVYLHDFAIKSTETSFQKIALDLYDTSMCEFERIYIWGSGGSGASAGACWSGSNSIGIRTHGRDSTSFKNIQIIADAPIYLAANPNTAANDGEDCDHFHFENLYLVANGNPVIEMAAGLGMMETTFDGFQAWVAGTAGFKINDTRAAPTVTSRGISFKNVRREQGESSTAYVFDCTFTVPVQNIGFEGVLMATGSNGIKLDGFSRAVLHRVTAAMTSTQLLVANVTSSSVLVLSGCIWQSTGTFTTTGLSAIHIQAYRSASFAAPSDAVYAGQITDSTFNVASGVITCTNATTGLRVTGTTGDALQVQPQAAGSGVSLRAVNNAQSDFEPFSATGEGFIFNNRSGAGTSAQAFNIDTAGNQVMGTLAAIATNATDGFLYVPTCAGTPTGTPTAKTGKAAIVVDTTNHKLYFYDGAWRDAGP